MPCLHCQRDRQIQCRGLCAACYKVPAIKAQYPPKKPGGNVRSGAWAKEPTEAELEALIAEQRGRLPEWWRDESTETREK
jgi:hypothetical protein